MSGYAGPPVETSGTGVLIVSISHNVAHHHWLVHHWLAHHWLVHHGRLALYLISCFFSWVSGQGEMGELRLVGEMGELRLVGVSVGMQPWVGRALITWLRNVLLSRSNILHKVFVLVCLSSG